jgi:5-histidylcysteine sulfoxide synthase/putative 4-mercaptohistidine N1-methyltranferase
MKWPPIREITEYRRSVYQCIKKLILEDPRLDPARLSISMETPAWALVMGFEHERIHLETSSVLMRELPVPYLVRPPQWAPPANRDSISQKVESHAGIRTVPPGTVTLGKPRDFPTFGWDNEYGRREVKVPEFAAQTSLTSNAEYLEFVRDGGYHEMKYWSEEGWNWRSFRNTKAPAFWVPQGPSGLHEYHLRTIFEIVEFQPDWPAVVNFHEAQAFCAWKTAKEKVDPPYRLPSEAEQNRLRAQTAAKSENANWNLASRYSSECSVYAYSSQGWFDLFGNVWQWCADHFNPLPGFQVHPVYEDFSGPCFDGRHQMIVGGSFVSSGDEASSFARFHFRPHFFQHSGFRVVRSLDARAPSTAVYLHKPHGAGGSDYESSELLAQYLLLHFATPEEVFPFAKGPKEALSFPQRCAEIVIAAARERKIKMERVLDIGCAVGGACFRLSEEFGRVVGIDLSSSFIQTAEYLRREGDWPYDRKDQGEIKTRLVARRPPQARPERIEFREADACQLPSDLHGFDVVMMANLLCRLQDPRRCLQAMSGEGGEGSPGTVRPGGLLVLFSPYSWLEQHTSRASWLGAQLSGGEVTSSEAITEVLQENFELIRQDDIPLLIREHERKYQYIISHMMIWQRRTRGT